MGGASKQRNRYMKSLASASFRTLFQIPDNATRYLNIAGGLANISTESQAELPVRHAGTASYLYIRATGNTNTVDGTTFTVRKSGADTGITVSFAAGVSGIMEDLSNTASFAATDEICIKAITPNDVSGSRLFNLAQMGVTYSTDVSTDAVSWMSVDGSTKTINSASTTEYYMLSGFNGTQATESWQALRVKADFTWSNLYVILSSNARVTDTTFRSRVNAADGNQIVTFGSGIAGVMEDGTNSDALVVDDDVDISWTTSTGTQNMVVVSVSSILHSDEGYFQMMWGAGTGTSISSNTTSYQAINSARGSATPTESLVQIYPRFDFTASEFGVNVETNTFSTLNTTVRLRDNGANGNMSMTYAAGAVGVQFDSGNTDTISSQDEIDYQAVTPNQAGAIQFLWMAMLGKEIVAGGSNIKTFDGLAYASTKSVKGLAIASVKTYNGLT